MIGSDWVFTKPRQWLNRMSDQSQIHYKIIIPHAINSSLPPTSRLKQLTNDLSVRPRPTRIPGVAVNSSPSNQTSTYPELSSLILLLPQSEGKTVILIMEPLERLPLLHTNLWSWRDRNCWRHFISFEESASCLLLDVHLYLPLMHSIIFASSPTELVMTQVYIAG